MRIVVVGAGAMGGLWAARLAAAGNEVAVLDVAADLVDSINASGITIQTDAGTEATHLVATNSPEEIGMVETVFFFVKAYHTASAAELAAPLVGPSTTVVSLQNGWGNADTLAETYAGEQLVVGVTYHSATLTGLGHVTHTGSGPTYVGPYSDGGSLERARAVGDIMNEAGLETRVMPTAKTEVWKKLVLNAATLPTSALTGLRAGELGEAGSMLQLVDALAGEATRVARALGYEIDAEERIERIHRVLEGAGAGKPSMLQDVEAHRKTEIEVVNGAVVRAADTVGIDAQLNRTMVTLIEGLERKWLG